MSRTNNLDKYWDEFISAFIRTLIADGYDEFEILDKVLIVLKEIKANIPEEKSEVESNDEVVPPQKDLSKIIEDVPERSFAPTKRAPHRNMKQHRNVSTHTRRCLSDKFLHSEVYVRGAKKESLATIERGPTRLVLDVYKLKSTGEELTEQEYLFRFNTLGVDLESPLGYLNRYAIRFVCNPQVSVGYVKNPKKYDKINCEEDIEAISIVYGRE